MAATTNIILDILEVLPYFFVKMKVVLHFMDGVQLRSRQYYSSGRSFETFHVRLSLKFSL